MISVSLVSALRWLNQSPTEILNGLETSVWFALFRSSQIYRRCERTKDRPTQVILFLKGPNRQNMTSVANCQATQKNWNRNYGFISDPSSYPQPPDFLRTKGLETVGTTMLVTVHAERDKNIMSGFYSELVFQFSDIASCFAGMLFLDDFTHQWPQGNGSLNVSIVCIITSQHVVIWLFYFVKYKKYHSSHKINGKSIWWFYSLYHWVLFYLRLYHVQKHCII